MVFLFGHSLCPSLISVLYMQTAVCCWINIPLISYALDLCGVIFYISCGMVLFIRHLLVFYFGEERSGFVLNVSVL